MCKESGAKDRPNEDVKQEIEDVIGIEAEDAPMISAKTGLNVEDVLEQIVEKIPAPQGDDNAPTKCLIFDSIYDNYEGAIAYVRVVDGKIKKGDKIITMSNGKEYDVVSLGYNTPFEKATMGNNADADLFVSIHRNALPTPNTGTGVETLVYNDQGIKATLARNINNELGNLGFDVRGVIERPNLVVLKRTKMPAVLVEAGFINNDADNEKFDAEFDDIARAIANGILNTVG